ncbi:SDR family NAD(P)-dependent oxidoreductase [Georgenia yuyongxinii]|uniref:SDR family NAD(P)-dependent oxidoreductase n=1 Tax=Georgenia yuyongxinii TaxID=2589797 RepID=A0A5B8C9L1_9MICO|nr:SDR family NAD(P)-dependent oxidoreductase [Georgenia yuyongxinii]QDC26125.1 SDR family NAD(P)-dependent oxidoreductase [Georgenia yuyongxinii]
MGTALVTGATSGIGLELAWQLAANRHRLVLVARDSGRLETLAGQLRAAAGVEVEVLRADLATAAGRDAVVARLRQDDAPVGLLVNNAGFGLGQHFLGGDLAREEEAIEVMVRAVLELSKAAAEAMVPRGRGAILNVSSMSALTTMGTYAAHKGWVLTFTEALAGELAGTGVTATVVCPGLVRTEFHDRAGLEAATWPAPAWIDVEKVATAALAGVRRGDVVVVPSLRYRVAAAALRHAPRALVRAVAGPAASGRAMTAR